MKAFLKVIQKRMCGRSIGRDFMMDPIIRMLDQNARGNTRGSIAVAKAFIRMGMWYRAFKSLKENIELKNKFDQILNSQNETELITLLNEFENINKEKKNCLTGEKAVILNAVLYLNNPSFYICAASLDHRKKIIDFLYGESIEYSSFGEKIILTNKKILDWFRSNNIQDSPRKISLFMYSIKDKWETNDEHSENADIIDDTETENTIYVSSQFTIEKYLEDFLIGNWENTELGKKYDLIFENNELISQQYKTEIGVIDLLMKN